MKIKLTKLGEESSGLPAQPDPRYMEGMTMEAVRLTDGIYADEGGVDLQSPHSGILLTGEYEVVEE